MPKSFEDTQPIQEGLGVRPATRKRILVIGGYGNFGSFISRRLARPGGPTVIIAGRSMAKAEALARDLPGAEATALDINQDLALGLARLTPDIVIHTSGPFQGQGPEVAEACIAAGCHYIDLADGRDFVTGITALDEDAKESGVTVVSGASSVPGLTAAIIDHHLDRFHHLESVDYGITTAQRTNRGLATTTAILGYVGKPFTTKRDGATVTVHGWQGLTSRRYRRLGARLLGYCDVPDLTLFPKRYPDLKSIRFSAGLELPFLHLGLWGLSWFVRGGLLPRLDRIAPMLLALSRWFDHFGTGDSGFHMTLRGQGSDGISQTIDVEIIARSGDGPYIPCMPAILLAERLARDEETPVGAYPCVGLISFDDYLGALRGMDIEWEVTERNGNAPR